MNWRNAWAWVKSAPPDSDYDDVADVEIDIDEAERQVQARRDMKRTANQLKRMTR